MSALDLKIRQILAESGQSSRAAERIEELVREREAAERDAALARIAELEAEAFKQRRKFENMAHFSEQHQERAERAEARISEAAKLHQPDWSDWGIDQEGASCSCGANYSYDECPTRIALGLNEGENEDE